MGVNCFVPKSLGTFPFGAPVLPCGDQLPGDVDAVVIGAYPSAVHVRWVPPAETGLRPISALAVENEPWVFWDGKDARERVDAWRATHFDSKWGSVTPAHLNGPSGEWLEANVLFPLRVLGSSSLFVTDCLTTYRLSVGAARRIDDTYQQLVAQMDGLPAADLLSHPSETEIVREALQGQAARLVAQIESGRPQRLVTLGNAASRVVTRLAAQDGAGTLTAGRYGLPRTVTLGAVTTQWVALVHPATPSVWQERHRAWLESGGFAV
jgi:hypothetical protein